MKHVLLSAIAMFAVSGIQTASAVEGQKDVFVESTFSDGSIIACPAMITQRGLVVTASHCTHKNGEQSKDFTVHIDARVDKSGEGIESRKSFDVPFENYHQQAQGVVYENHDLSFLGNDLGIFYSEDVRSMVKSSALGWKPSEYPVTGYDANGYDEKEPFYIRLPGGAYAKCKQKGSTVSGTEGARPAKCPKTVRIGHSGSPVFQKQDGEYFYVGFLSGGNAKFAGEKGEFWIIQTVGPNQTIEVIRLAMSKSDDQT